MGVFDDTIRFLSDVGVADVLLPFFLVFAVAFAILQRTNILGGSARESRRFDVIVALVMGFAVIFPHVLSPGSRFDVVPVINNALPQASLVIIAIVVILLLMGILGAHPVSINGPYAGWLLWVPIIIVIYIFLGASGTYFRLPYWLSSPRTISIVVVILVFLVGIGYIMRDDQDEQERERRRQQRRENINIHLGGGGNNNNGG